MERLSADPVKVDTIRQQRRWLHRIIGVRNMDQLKEVPTPLQIEVVEEL